MKKPLLFALLLSLLFSCGQSEEKNDSFDPNTIHIGETPIRLIHNFTDSDNEITFVNLHADEETSILAIKKLSLERKINYFYLNHEGTRRINFILHEPDFGIYYQPNNFDPNRIFTEKGRIATLADGEGETKSLEVQLSVFAKVLLIKLRVDPSKTIIAMHNNTADEYSILSYLPEGDESQNTAEVFVNEDMDPDDFIYTTDKNVYDALVTENINVILQDNDNFVDDGSLSVYCGGNGIRYINIETEHGHITEQYDLMKLILSILEK
ncbi:MAG: hypothetical protein QNK23_15575 [Crocinitomicaceae bacterium]|nr:hypothetical protein [Crocinitomicaceae bacterium]